MKKKVVIQTILFLAIILVCWLLTNKEVLAVDRFTGSVSNNTVLSSYGNYVTVKFGSQIDVANAWGNSIFRNPNVFCIQKGTSLGSYHSYFTVGEEKSINSKSHNVLKGLAYILTYQTGNKLNNYNLYNDNDDVQKALWRYINEYKNDTILKEFLGANISGISGTSDEAYRIYAIANAIAKGALDDVGNKSLDGVKMSEKGDNIELTNLPINFKATTIDLNGSAGRRRRDIYLGIYNNKSSI